MVTYGPRCNVHPDRTGASRTGPYRLLVVHTSEGSEGPTSAENLCSFMTLPGDRTDPTDGSRYGASYHYVTDTDRVFPATPDNIVAYAAAGANNDGIHICMPGKAAQTRDQWLDTVSRAYIRQLAAVMVDKGREHHIPLRPLAVIQIVAGQTGYCGHVDISNAYHRSTHTDPGSAFPWDVLADDIAELTEPEPIVDYFTLKTPPAALYQVIAPGVAVYVHPDTWEARGNPAGRVMPAAEAATFLFLPTLPRSAVG